MSAARRAAVVTGASSGIGRAASVELVGRGYQVIAVARGESRLEGLRRELGELLVPIVADITDPDGVLRIRERVIESTGGRGPDAVVNNAGLLVFGPTEATSEEIVRRQFEINVIALLAVSRAFLPEMRERRRGRIVNVSSILGRVALPGAGVYSASKHAVEAISDAMRAELRPFGVRVVLIEPAFTRTDLFDSGVDIDAGQLDGYAELFADTERAQAENIRKGVAPSVVGRVVADAVTAARPRDRYVVPARARLLLAMLTNVPVPIRDRIMSGVAGLRRSL